MERENIIAATKERLEQFNLGDLNRYKESTQEQFITIEQYFLQTEERINKALEEIKSINFNIRGICNTINISKSTVYNNPNTLRLYIEERINDIENQDLLSKNKQGKQQIRISELEKFLDRTIIDQIEFNNLKVHNECLQDEVNRLTERNELLGLERAKLVRRLNDMDLELRKLRNKKENVVSFNQD
ncbi:hypothetical protein BCJMU51_4871 [Bacillus cereus]|uniref:DUF3967 domain-containing protein n=1 Tax=Bacillus cereus TaxID=1396 RepID=A0A150AUE6_BACCE|nr:MULTISPECIES: hypothetical protein [Bacillus]EJR53762.1 hypothetical protein IIK_00028 [Bacillus cereus VD102]OUA67667.1 hypothetical protein BK786_10090 [Bacillus thuringiensis serovar thailandensis]HDR7794042.1 hypothetical protein [Bacillus luti]HDX9539675.1 hypothetical protein [Bacillus thuringiensis]KLA12078.1 hypothetical protein B4087_4549 [Bacillus cereus]